MGKAMTVAKIIQAALGWLLALFSVTVQAAVCSNHNLDVVVLGSGGPELDDRRASVGYLVRENGRAAVLVDFGTGASFNFERAGARIEDLQAVLLRTP